MIMANDEIHLVELFSKNYINIVQTTSGNKTASLGDPSNPELQSVI